MFIEYGGEVNFLAGTIDGGYVDDKMKMMNVALPVNLVYQFSFMDGAMDVAPYAGLNFKFNIIGKTDVEGEGADLEVNHFDEDDMGEDETANRFQLGLNLGVNFYYNNFMVGYRYQYDFIPYIKYDDYKMKTSGNFISVGYRF